MRAALAVPGIVEPFSLVEEPRVLVDGRPDQFAEAYPVRQAVDLLDGYRAARGAVYDALDVTNPYPSEPVVLAVWSALRRGLGPVSEACGLDIRPSAGTGVHAPAPRSAAFRAETRRLRELARETMAEAIEAWLEATP